MSWLVRFRNIFRPERVSDEIDRELAFHLAERADDLAAAGASDEAARHEARRRFGSYALQTERTRDRDVIVWLETLITDLRSGLRGMRRDPVFCLTAVLTLAIGIGANTAVFTLLYGLILRSLPVVAPGELARIGVVSLTDPRPATRVPYRLLQQFRQQQRSFVDVSAWVVESIVFDDQDGTPRFHLAGLVGGNGFELLGVRPRLGRLLAPSDDVPGGPSQGWPVVISDAFWRDRFAGEPAVIGAPLRLTGSVVTVVGVLPASFQGVWPGREPKFYAPINYLTVLMDRREALDSPTAPAWCAAIGRLKPGVSLEEANAELAVHQQQLLTEYRSFDSTPQPLDRTMRLAAEPARTGLPTSFGRTYAAPLMLMQSLVGIVLLLCCVNVSGLMLSKLHGRQHEFAVRRALGAARTRLVRQYLTESLVIASAGAALGGVAAWYGSGLLLQFFRDPNSGIGMAVQPDHAVYVVTAAFAVLTTLVVGTLPAWRTGDADPCTLLKSRTAAQRQLAGRSFVVVQVGLSLVLVVLAALLSQSLSRLRSESTGFDVNGVTIQTPPFHLLPQKNEAKLDVYQQMVDRLAQSPGIRSAAVTWYTPMTGLQATASFQALTDGPTSQHETTLAYNAVGAGYFRTMATAIRAGREFEREERRRDVCVLNRSAADVLFPGQPAVGRYVRATTGLMPLTALDSPAAPVRCRVVGVAEDAKFANLREPPPKTIYFPVTAEIANANLVFLLSAPTKAQAIAGYRDALRAVAPTMPLVLFATLREQMDAALGSQRAITLLSVFFGGVALVLSALGLYGMLSSSVTQRTGEIGVRVALGASRGAIVRMVVSDALRLMAVGIMLGTIALIFTTQSIAHLLYGVSAFDPATWAGTAVLLTFVALFAAIWPARRAASVDPVQAMRAD